MAYRILIVDDDIELLKMLKNYFEIKRYDVMMAEDGTDALEKIHKKPDIILLDINMPKIDGLEVCRRIRGKVTCPIIFLTAKVEEQDRVNGLLSGGDDYILKPFSLKELDARIIAEGDSRVVTELIRRVRKKLAEYTQTEYIETVWGMGYRWKR